MHITMHLIAIMPWWHSWRGIMWHHVVGCLVWCSSVFRAFLLVGDGYEASMRHTLFQGISARSCVKCSCRRVGLATSVCSCWWGMCGAGLPIALLACIKKRIRITMLQGLWMNTWGMLGQWVSDSWMMDDMSADGLKVAPHDMGVFPVGATYHIQSCVLRMNKNCFILNVPSCYSIVHPCHDIGHVVKRWWCCVGCSMPNRPWWFLHSKRHVLVLPPRWSVGYNFRATDVFLLLCCTGSVAITCHHYNTVFGYECTVLKNLPIPNQGQDQLHCDCTRNEILQHPIIFGTSAVYQIWATEGASMFLWLV